MAQSTLVTKQVEDGAALVRRLREDHFDVSAACWIHEQDRDDWLLFIASPVVDQMGVIDAYQAYFRTFYQITDSQIGPLDVMLVGASDPVAKAVESLNDRFPARGQTRYHLRELGGMPIQEVHVYPRNV